MEKVTRLPAIIILLATVCGLGYCLWRITQNPTPNEALLLSLFMTVLSVLASWIISKYYARVSYEDNLRVFARKAAEKVTNLSKELDRLSTFLQTALDEDGFSSPGEELLAKSIRFEDAIHLITALRSVNDTSLSDWRGIIGDELSKQREAQIEEQEEREDRLREIMERLEIIQQESAETAGQREMQERERLRTELGSLRSDMRLLASQVGGVRLGPAAKRRTVELSCPRCSRPIEFSYSTTKPLTKKIDCKGCNAHLYASSDGSECFLRERVPISESLTCPVCSAVATENIDPLYGTMHEYHCASCDAHLRASRSRNGINVRVVLPEATLSKGSGVPISGLSVSPIYGQQHDLPEELLSRIREEMGPQPWPKGKSHDVRLALGISRYTIDYAIKHLIAQGDFKPQVGGVLYGPIDAP